MPYLMYLDGVLMPVTPSKIEMKIKNQNKTINLMDGSEINILKAPGLTEISFELLIPQVWYPFSVYPAKGEKKVNNAENMQVREFLSASYYLDVFQKLKTQKPKFQFKVERTTPDGSEKLFDTLKDMLVSLEEYSIIEDSGNGLDITVALNLKQYREYYTVIYTIDKNNNLILKNNSVQETVPEPYTVKQGDTLWGICKKYVGDGAKYPLIAKLNGIKNPNQIKAGQVIRFG
jgi:nucleoid-associated protein YgaU